MLTPIKSKKIIYNGQRFNSHWEYIIYKKIVNILPKKLHPINVNSKIPGYRLELDIYIPKLKLAFELQGPSHFHNLKVINRDLFKANICKRLNIHIIYLYFNKYYKNCYLRSELYKNREK